MWVRVTTRSIHDLIVNHRLAELKVAKAINELPSRVKDRFAKDDLEGALWVLRDMPGQRLGPCPTLKDLRSQIFALS